MDSIDFKPRKNSGGIDEESELEPILIVTKFFSKPRELGIELVKRLFWN
jgi:hypothetical protein